MFLNKRILLTTALLTTLVVSVQANKIRTAPQIFIKKCAMCHTIGKPNNKVLKKKMVAPPIDVAMKGVVITIDAVDGPFKDKELRTESISFLKDYLYEPTEEKTNCEDIVVKKFGRMPSLKGFISPQELDIVVPWVYDKFKPLKINGKYQK